jgi:nitrogen fixation NifU-like protein
MLVEHVEGRTVETIKQFSAQDMLALIGVPLTPLRQRCCLLAWQCLQVAIYSPIQRS